MAKIKLISLLWMLLPLSVVFFYYIKYTKDAKTPFIAIFRMVLQLLLIGYLLVFIFTTKSHWLVVCILFIMLLFAAIISLRPLKSRSKNLYLNSFLAIALGVLVTLAIVVFGVIRPKVWYEPRIVIPLAGMIFANSMNTVSIFAERYFDTKDISKSLKASLIPIINSFFAVGLVSLPGMMTGQILSGIDPLIAVRYQILVMLMVLSGSGISVLVFANLLKD
jgi:putative ABC transport system permease protein